MTAAVARISSAPETEGLPCLPSICKGQKVLFRSTGGRSLYTPSQALSHNSEAQIEHGRVNKFPEGVKKGSKLSDLTQTAACQRRLTQPLQDAGSACRAA